MQDKTQSDRKAVGTPGNFTTDAAEDRAKATEKQNAGGGTVAGRPALQNDDSGQSYSAERHKFTEQSRTDERVPSAGWREVYFSMGVEQR